MRFVSIFILAHLVFTAKVSSQVTNESNSFILSGTINGKDTGIIILGYPDSLNNWLQDTAVVQSGTFQFTGVVSQPGFCLLKEGGKKGKSAGFFLEAGEQKIFLNNGDFENFKMIGSFTERQNDTLKKATQKIYSKYGKWLKEKVSVLNQYNREKDSIAKKNLQKKLDFISDRNEAINEAFRKETIFFITQHPDSYVSPGYLYTFLLNRSLETDSAEAIFNRFTSRIKNSFAGKSIQQELNKRKLYIEAPDFSAKDFNNKNISLSAFKGKYVLLDFWASWCVPCLKQLPELKEYLKKYNNKGFEIIAISIDTGKEKWMDAISKNEIRNFYHVLANEDIKSKYSNTIQPIPSGILINRNGIIIWNSMHQATDLKTILKKEFGE